MLNWSLLLQCQGTLSADRNRKCKRVQFALILFRFALRGCQNNMRGKRSFMISKQLTSNNMHSAGS